MAIDERMLKSVIEEVLKEMAGKATAGDTMKVGAFQKMGEKELYEIYKKANHR